MSTCTRCGATFHCALSDPSSNGSEGGAGTQPCWCTALPPAVPVPGQGEAVGCWCPDCLRKHIDELERRGVNPP